MIMMIKRLKMLVSIMLVLFLIMNITLLAMRKTSAFLFWTIIVVCAVFAYVVLPRINKTH